MSLDFYMPFARVSGTISIIKNHYLGIKNKFIVFNYCKKIMVCFNFLISKYVIMFSRLTHFMRIDILATKNVFIAEIFSFISDCEKQTVGYHARKFSKTLQTSDCFKEPLNVNYKLVANIL